MIAAGILGLIVGIVIVLVYTLRKPKENFPVTPVDMGETNR